MAIIKMSFRSEYDYPWVKRMLEKYFGCLLLLRIEKDDTNIYQLQVPTFTEDEDVSIRRMDYSPLTDSAHIVIGRGDREIKIN